MQLPLVHRRLSSYNFPALARNLSANVLRRVGLLLWWVLEIAGLTLLMLVKIIELLQDLCVKRLHWERARLTDL